MFKKLSYAEFEGLSQQQKRIIVHREIPGDHLTPVNVFLALEKAMTGVTLLESKPKEKHRSRYSYLCFEPIAEFKAFGKKITIEESGKVESFNSNAFEALRQFQEKHRIKGSHQLCGFVGGTVGFLSYDAVRLIERLPNKLHDLKQYPDLYFRAYNTNIVFDHETGKVVISTAVSTQSDCKTAYQSALDSINHVIDLIEQYQPKQQSLINSEDECPGIQIQTDIEDEHYLDLVEKSKSHIRDGDIFQVVLSRQFNIPIKAKPFEVYRALKVCNPAPFMFYMDCNEFTIAGSSPEKLISINNGIIESCPLAGTRLRKNDDSDKETALGLLSDEKEVAEHMMLVDLARNDVGAIAKPGSVKVTKLKEIEFFAKVMHISSTIQGELRDDKDAIDALKAAFPAGTLSGAPKIRAMEIIDDLEQSPRGVYGGAICAFDGRGDLESCIAIRMTVLRDGIASVRAGGGIVADSNPQAEADETRHKAKAVLESIRLAEGGTQS